MGQSTLTKINPKKGPMDDLRLEIGCGKALGAGPTVDIFLQKTTPHKHSICNSLHQQHTSKPCLGFDPTSTPKPLTPNPTARRF